MTSTVLTSPINSAWFSSLTHLNLSNSNLLGQIPSEMALLSKLQFFLSENSELGLAAYDFKMLLQNLTQLRELHLSGVNISSTIPLNFSSHLTTTGLRGTGLDWYSVHVIYWGQFRNSLWNLIRLECMDLQDNHLEGPIFPQFTGGLRNLSTVKLSNNSLKGAIPSWIFSWPSLSYLDLSNNHFSGQLKDFRYNLILVIIDTSENQLQGLLPKSIQNLESVVSIYLSLNQLQVLNLSRNHLERCIPKRPQFATYENNSYEGNDGLRGFLVSGGCGSNLIPKKNNKTFVPNEEGDSTFLNELCWEVVLMRYGCGLIIGFSIAYVMLSYQKPNWLSRIAEELEYIISMRNRKKPRE
ncbi:hypothetical protein FXO38_24747 [Capsicum annuum]|nr:hypothetical protein FXO38_24747 [Capsicum annuum]